MASIAQSPPASPRRPSAWFWEFLREELAPYPGRLATVGRMVLAATLVMIIGMTFRIPYSFQGAIYALFITRESPRATLESGRIILLVTAVSTAYVLFGAYFVISFPSFHFLWNVASFFLAFFAISTINNYGAVVIFVNTVSFAVPIWDQHVSAETNVENTLRLALVSFIGVAITAAVELIFRRAPPGDDIVKPIADRLDVVHNLLLCYAEARPLDHAAEEKLVRMGMRGTSSVRRELRRSDYSPQYRAQMGGVVALVSRLVDISATLSQLNSEFSSADLALLRKLASNVASIRTDLLSRRIPDSISIDSDNPAQRAPLLNEMEYTIALIPQAFAGSESIDSETLSEDAPRFSFLAPDAFINPEHYKFALKGGLAASACYIIYNAIAWPGISTAVATCLLTGLSTIGASRQKQILRLTGALVGGLLIGMGSQIFILPYLDSIGGFTVLFVLVTAAASWVLTSSPRLSYFGVQVALAYYLINLQEFAFQTSLSIARDRVVGILLGLFMMWLVFDQLWKSPAGLEMKKAFTSSLRLLAQLAREPVSTGRQVAMKRSYALRATINAAFDNVRSLADGVLFEFGASRQRDLALRDCIRQWQPQLRALFLMRVATLKYRLRLQGFELPEAVRVSQQEYDDRSARMLEDLADRIEGKLSDRSRISEDSFERLQKDIWACCPDEPHVRTFVALVQGLDRLTTSLTQQIATEFVSVN